jgi:hypothetical protein
VNAGEVLRALDSHARQWTRSLFLRKWACRRMAANGLGIILFRHADWLLEKGYSRNAIHLYTQALEHFGFWRAKHHPHSQSVQASEVAEFLNSHLCAHQFLRGAALYEVIFDHICLN